MKRIIIFLTLISLFSVMSPSSADAAARSARVTIPKFPVTLNGTRIDSLYREYPLITYKDITYFPMTFYDSRYLGLETIWNNNEMGLFINKTGASGLYRDYRGVKKNTGYGTATVCPFPVKVNGADIDNANEEYPLLLFRGVTYFPMTWRFCRDMFGWEYEFTEKDGLKITSANPTVESLNINLPESMGISLPESDDMTLFGFIVFDGQYYAFGADRAVYQGSLTDPARREVIYRIPDGSLGGLYVDENRPYLRYHVGGAIMGADVTIQLNSDGTTEQVSYGYHLYKDFGDMKVIADQRLVDHFAGNNLTVRRGDGEYQSVGDPDFFYGAIVEIKQGENGYTSAAHTSDLYRIGDDIYTLACDMTKKEGSSGIYKVNLKTGETTCLVESSVIRFVMKGDYIYYISGGVENQIRRLCLSSGELIPIAGPYKDSRVTDVAVLNNIVYFTMFTYWPHADGNGFHGFYRADNSASLGFNTPINYKTQVAGMKILGDYLAVSFEGYSDIDDRFIVIDADGYIVFRTDDEVSIANVSVVDDRLYYVDSGSRRAGVVTLSAH